MENQLRFARSFNSITFVYNQDLGGDVVVPPVVLPYDTSLIDVKKLLFNLPLSISFDESLHAFIIPNAYFDNAVVFVTHSGYAFVLCKIEGEYALGDICIVPKQLPPSSLLEEVNLTIPEALVMSIIVSLHYNVYDKALFDSLAAFISARVKTVHVTPVKIPPATQDNPYHSLLDEVLTSEELKSLLSELFSKKGELPPEVTPPQGPEPILNPLYSELKEAIGAWKQRSSTNPEE